MFADHQNDKIYGLIVKRSYSTAELRKSKYYWLLMTRGNGMEDDANCAIPTVLKRRMTTRPPNLSCTIRRVEVIQVRPYQHDGSNVINWEFYWRPFGLTYE